MFDDTVATIVGWAMIGALPALLAINMVLQGLNRPYRKYLHKLQGRRALGADPQRAGQGRRRVTAPVDRTEVTREADDMAEELLSAGRRAASGRDAACRPARRCIVLDALPAERATPFRCFVLGYLAA